MRSSTSLSFSFLLATGLLLSSALPGWGSGGEAKAGGGYGSSKKSARKASKPSSHSTAIDYSTSPQLSDVDALLSMIAARERKHDPRLYVEVNLGEFRLTHPGAADDELLLMNFHIYGVMHEQDWVRFEKAVAGREQRLRDAVLSVVHKTPYEQLGDPSLDVVKSNLVAAINRVLEADILRDVAFSQLSMERG